MTDERTRHDFKNQLAIIHGFAELLLAEAAADDPRRADFQEIAKAAVIALELLAGMAPQDVDRPAT
jgi:hypothetical protein